MNHQIKKYFQLTQGPTFLPFFCGLAAVFFFLKDLDLTLTDFPGEMIGIATLHGVDISKRVNLLYWSLGIFTAVLFLINGFLRVLETHFPKQIPSTRLLNVLAFLGIFLVLIAFFSEAAGLAINLIFTIILLSWLHVVLLPSSSETNNETSDFATVLIAAVGLAFLLREILIFSGKISGHFLTDYLLYCGPAVLLFKKFIPSVKNKKLAEILLVWLAGIPLMIVFSNELRWFIFHRFDISLSGIVMFPLVWFVSLFLWMSGQRMIPKISTLKSSALLLFFGLIVFAFYTPVIPHPTEMFELANPALGLSRFYNFGELPVLETFNSHLLFELLFGFIYSLIHGFHGLDFLTYDFLHQVMFYLLAFLFLRRWLQNNYLTFAALLFFPLMFELFPPSFAIVFLPIFAFENWLKKGNLSSRIWLLSSLFILILWKIDLGYGAVLAAISLIVILWISRNAPSDILGFTKATLWIVVPVAIITYLIVIIKGIPFDGHFKQALHYLSSAQTYGYDVLAGELDSLYFAHYFLFPVFIWIGFLALLYQLKRHLTDHRFETLSLLFLTLFYLFNFHRGLIRHGFMENSDQWLSSFGYFIIPGMIITFFFRKKTRETKNLVVFSSAFLLIIAFNYPPISHPGFAAENLHDAFNRADTQAIQNGRLTGTTEFEEELSDIRNFFNTHLSAQETFYDYSNSPILYVYLNRSVPSYFNQMLLSMHDEYLQQCIMDSLESQNIRYIVYSGFPETWYDMQDGVPKDVRHYHLGEYIHRRYEPLAIAGDYCIWKLKGTDAQVDTVALAYAVDTVDHEQRLIFKVPDHKKIWIRVKGSLSIQFEGTDTIYSPNYAADSTAYFHFESKDIGQGLILKYDDLQLPSLEVFSCSYYPDLYSNRNKNYNLRRLPEIWAQNYKASGYEEISLQQLPEDSKAWFEYALPPEIDKSQGNFILIEGYTGNEHYNDCEVLMMAGENYLGTFRFKLNEKGKNNRYLIRVSSQNNWNKMPDRLIIQPNHYLAEFGKVKLLTPLPSNN